MKANYSDIIRVKYQVYLEPVLATEASHYSKKVGSKTMSKYIRYAVIMQLLRDGCPLGSLSNKFNKFIDLHRHITACK